MNITKGMTIEFTEAVFIGTYPNGRYDHDRTITAHVLKDSYGAKTGQHTFTLQIIECDDGYYESGEQTFRKGRNVYKNCRIIDTPTNYEELAEEKSKRRESAKERKFLNNNPNHIPAPGGGYMKI